MEDSLRPDSPLEEPETKKGRWTKDEDELLRKAVDELGEKQWRAVSQRVPGRTTIQCLHRWNKILKPGLVKGPWSPMEDNALLEWVRIEGPTKWTLCSERIPGRSGKQCRERWFNTLDPDVKKGDWQESEDKIIFRMYHKVGPKWTEMTKFLPGRTENSIKNRFYSTIRKAKSRTPEDLKDPTLIEGTMPVASTEPGQVSVSMQVVTLLQQMQKLEILLSRTRQQIVYLEESIDSEEKSAMELEDSSQEVLV